MLYEPRMDEIPKILKSWIRPGDIVLTLGAGSVHKVGDALLKSAGAARAGRTRAS